MSFEATRRDLIAFRADNSRNPVFFHRASTSVSQLEHLQCPADARHKLRLRKALNLTAREIAQARREGGRYVPSHQRTRPYRKSR
ncbi:hypothetical protein FNL55_12825 [Tardiphaga sp. vice352]|uniref:hypothetical protein n=1 Tax=Tardiphaga sp. vice352 TaxID=2592816 RepID=UPI001164888A|nr:hypothetical protein [Tardiphaga sp. vice352]QDM32123.1 hypothetical protein FNL55_12825 [Tardiphaga sp. vice352]